MIVMRRLLWGARPSSDLHSYVYANEPQPPRVLMLLCSQVASPATDNHLLFITHVSPRSCPLQSSRPRLNGLYVPPVPTPLLLSDVICCCRDVG